MCWLKFEVSSLKSTMFTIPVPPAVLKLPCDQVPGLLKLLVRMLKSTMLTIPSPFTSPGMSEVRVTVEPAEAFELVTEASEPAVAGALVVESVKKLAGAY